MRSVIPGSGDCGAWGCTVCNFVSAALEIPLGVNAIPPHMPPCEVLLEAVRPTCIAELGSAAGSWGKRGSHGLLPTRLLNLADDNATREFALVIPSRHPKHARPQCPHLLGQICPSGGSLGDATFSALARTRAEISPSVGFEPNGAGRPVRGSNQFTVRQFGRPISSRSRLEATTHAGAPPHRFD